MFAELPAWVPYAYFAVIGLIVGSFLNVVIHRLPREQSLWKPGSRCPSCEQPVLARDNIPVISYLVLRGQCRHCKNTISWRYPLVEVLTALAFVAAGHHFGFSRASWVAAVFLAALLALAAIDLQHMILPDVITLPGVAVGLLSQLWVPNGSFSQALIGALGGAGALILLINLWYWLREEESMGLGDVNMMAFIGAFLGWRNAMVAMALATASGAAVGLMLMTRGRAGWKSKIPFGVFLALGAALALFFGPDLFAAYIDLYR